MSPGLLTFYCVFISFHRLTFFLMLLCIKKMNVSPIIAVVTDSNKILNTDKYKIALFCTQITTDHNVNELNVPSTTHDYMSHVYIYLK